ncbi:MAG: hypothetical protein K8U03_00745 [Planctomycetia bacterium]|nr:hypothetical protein [Planctomycetia bacterium]
MIASTSKFNDLLSEVGRLSLEEQTEFVNVLQHRLIELRRDEIAADIAEGMKEFAEGKSTPTTVEEIMRELKS